MKHFILMLVFAALVAIIFGTIGRQNFRARVLYAVKVFGEFTGIGLILAWLIYLIF